MRVDTVRQAPAKIGGLAMLALAAILLLGSDRVASAQNAIEPAEEIRVVEQENRWSGRRERVVVEALTPAEILRIQVALAEARHDPGVRTGVLDFQTRRALTRFQAKESLLICGCPTYETIVALEIPPVVVDDRYAAVRRDHRSGGVILLPGHHHGHHHHVRKRGAGVIVGLDGGSGVFVGHAPARGAGQVGREKPRRGGHDRQGVRPARPTPPRGGGRITPGIRPAPPARPPLPASPR